MASANLRYRINGGAVQSTSQEVASGDVISLLATSYAGWATPAARWEIVAYPPSWGAPAGWSTDADNGRYYYLANSGVSGVTPPTVTIPDPATTWGKWTFRLTVNGSVVSSDLSVETVSPSLGLHDLALAEGSQFGGTRQWVGQHQENLRTLDAKTGGANAGAAYVTDSATVVNASDRPLRGLTGTLPFKGTNVAPASFERASAQASTSVAVGEWNRSVSDASGHGATGTAGYWSMYIPDGAGTKSEAARFAWSWSTILGPYADFVLSVATNPGGGGLGPVITFSGGGAIRLHGSTYAHSGYRLILDASGNVSASAVSSSEVTTALGYTPVTNARTLTGTSPITIAGDNAAHDLSADRTIAFSVAADVPWGGHGITGIASLDNSGGPLDLGANTTSQSVGKSGTTWAIRGAATVAGTLGMSDAVTITKAGNGATDVAGFTLTNTTATTGGVTEQRPPEFVLTGHGRNTSAGGSDEQIDVMLQPTFTAAAGGAAIEWRPKYQRALGGWNNFGGYWTTSAPGLGGTAFVVGTMIIDTSGNGVRFSNNGNGGMKQSGTDVMVTSGGSNAVGLATNSTWRLYISSTGAITISKDTSAIERTQHGTAGTNYVDRTGSVTTVSAFATTTLQTIATASNSYVKVEVDAVAYDTLSTGLCTFFGKRKTFVNSAGTITEGSATDLHADDAVGGVWGAPPTLSITHSGTNILIQGTAPGDACKFIITEVRVHVGTTSA